MRKDITTNRPPTIHTLEHDELASFLEEIYNECNQRDRVCRDPLAIVLRYDDVADREVVGMVCSMLAFGGVDLILRACEKVLLPLGSHPAAALDSLNDSDFQRFWGDFQYRFCFPHDMICFLKAIQHARSEYGSLEALFLHGDDGSGTIVGAASKFVEALHTYEPFRENLLPNPSSGSACKRLFLFLRWMVRCDAVDPGGWTGVSASRLVVPLDLHMLRTCHDRLGFIPPRNQRSPHGAKAETGRSCAPRYPALTLRMALGVTRRFAEFSPDDPVKYDFALTRPGIDPRPGDEAFQCL
jgi:uncharacterized protein (TIGR02757 family)